jgi:hypothetical protein
MNSCGPSVTRGVTRSKLFCLCNVTRCDPCDSFIHHYTHAHATRVGRFSEHTSHGGHTGHGATEALCDADVPAAAGAQPNAGW